MIAQSYDPQRDLVYSLEPHAFPSKYRMYNIEQAASLTAILSDMFKVTPPSVEVLGTDAQQILHAKWLVTDGWEIPGVYYHHTHVIQLSPSVLHGTVVHEFAHHLATMLYPGFTESHGAAFLRCLVECYWRLGTEMSSWEGSLFEEEYDRLKIVSRDGFPFNTKVHLLKQEPSRLPRLPTCYLTQR